MGHLLELMTFSPLLGKQEWHGYEVSVEVSVEVSIEVSVDAVLNNSLPKIKPYTQYKYKLYKSDLLKYINVCEIQRI